MNAASCLRPALGLALLVLFPLTTWAQGVVIDRDGRPVSGLELSAHRVEATLHEQVAVVTVTHTFRNTGRTTVEGSFLFPLPPEAQVSRFQMEVDGQTLGGELLSAEEARRIYEEIVRRSLDPALLELVDYRTFRARVFPIPPGATRTLTLRYDATLPAEGQTVAFRYPLRGSLSHRPTGGPVAGPVPRGPAAEAGQAPAAPVGSVRVTIAAERRLRAVYSPSHEVAVQRQGERRAEVVLERAPLDGRDFVLYYGLDDRDIGASLLSFRPYRDQPGYFLLVLAPPVEVEAEQVAPKDVVFVLDTSGSMSGEKMTQAREALRYCLERLGPRDRFGIVAFNSDVEPFRDRLVPATARDDARYFVDQLAAGGGTNIHAALLEAMALVQGSDNGQVIFLTDGLPSVGTTDEGAIRKAVAAANRSGTRLFAFGVGYDVNTRLLDGLAHEAGAFADYISPDETIEGRVAAFFDKVRFPVLTNLELAVEGADVFALAPGALPDLYKGGQVVLAGRYRRAGAATLTLSGEVGGRRRTERYGVRFPEVERERDFVARLWATRRVGQLLDEVRRNGERPALKDEIVALAKEYGLVTPYTAYLVREEDAVAEEAVRDAGRLQRGSAPPPVMAAPEALQQVSGAAAVQASRKVRALQEAQAVDAPAQGAPFVAVEGRLMRRTADGWQDDAYDGREATVRLRFASDAYFAFLRAYPEARAFARLGERVLFRFRDRWVAVGPEEGDVAEADFERLFGR